MAETVWASFLKMSEGFTDLTFDALTLIFLFISLYLLNRGFRAGLPTGPCYAVWTGIGAVGSVVVGLVFFGDALNWLGWVFLAVLLIGVIGLNLAPDGKTEGDDVAPRGRTFPGCRSPCRRSRRTRRWA